MRDPAIVSKVHQERAESLTLSAHSMILSANFIMPVHRQHQLRGSEAALDGQTAQISSKGCKKPEIEGLRRA